MILGSNVPYPTDRQPTTTYYYPLPATGRAAVLFWYVVCLIERSNAVKVIELGKSVIGGTHLDKHGLMLVKHAVSNVVCQVDDLP